MQEISDDAVVVRGGSVREVSRVLAKIMDAIGDGDGPVLSVYCLEPEGESTADVVPRLCRLADVQYGKIQISTVGALRSAGLQLVHSVADGEPDCHYHVDFGDDVDELRVEAFIKCLQEPIVNPAKGLH